MLMHCPHCQNDLSDDARYCAKCGRSVEIATRVDIRQDVEHNLGRVIGVQTQAIHGDVYGGDVYEVQVYALTDAGRDGSWRRFLQENTPPYRSLSPYTARDRILFKGRDEDIRQVVGRVGAQRVVVLYGQTGVGKTSLLAAGVIPQLVKYGALVVNVQDYLQPAETIRAALTASSEQLRFPLPAGRSLPALISALKDATSGTLVLVLDQFERFFEPSLGSDQREAFVEGLAESLRAVEPECLRVVLAVHEDTLARLGDLQADLPDLLRSPVQLLPLSRQQAKMAIQQPLEELNYPVSFVGGLVDDCLLPDLDDLTPDVPGQIHPPHLQVVCRWLYEAASRRHPPLIDAQLYIDEAKGADGITARYLEETLRTRLAGERSLAERALTVMASPGSSRWVAPGQLAGNGASPDRLRKVLERLVETGLLARRAVDGRHQYSFVSQTVLDEVRRLVGPEVERRYQAGDELERIWSAWLVRDALATRGQLRYLSETAAHLRPRPVKTLLLLRSAVARDEPPDPWLAWLGEEGGGPLIRQLEEPEAAVGGTRVGRSTQNKAELLLGLRDASLPGQPANEGGRYGPVAWSAVAGRDPVTRQAAALALAVPYQSGALERLEAALQAGPAGWKRRRRRAELRGTLADARPEIETMNAGLPPMDRASVWLWRVRRRLFRDRHRITALTLGAAIGAGLGLGLLRAVTAAVTRMTVGLHFAMNSYWGALLGAALVCGMALAGPLLLSRPGEAEETRTAEHSPPRPGRRSAALAAGLGTLFFGTVHLLLAWLLGLSAAGSSPARVLLVIALGYLAGLGLALALYGQPQAGRRMGMGRWLLRLGVAVVALVGAQAVFMAAEDTGGSISIVWPAGRYGASLGQYALTWWQQLMSRFPQWPDAVALIDAGLVGIVLAIGTTAGLLLAAKWLARWRSLVARAGE